MTVAPAEFHVSGRQVKSITFCQRARKKTEDDYIPVGVKARRSRELWFEL